jgi:very-short-patch-repair endonuclease
MERKNLKPSTRRARALRQQSPDAERKLWALLRNRQLGGYKFRRQVPVDRYFADFACLDARLIVELDGDQHNDQAVYDAGRTATLQALGWRVLRFPNGEVYESPHAVADTILFELGLPTR